MSKYLTLFCLVSLTLRIYNKKVFLYHDQSRDQQELFKFFYDKNDGYYVDIGGYDPIFISNTINLYARGWDGINIQAHPVRFAAFPQIKSQDVNLNLAGYDSEKFLTFYENEWQVSQSTVVEDVYNTLKKNGNIAKLQVPAMSMKQLCYRYFKKKPNYINMDVQGASIQLLSSNDWSNSKCRPQIIFVEKGKQQKDSHKQFMAQKGYTYIQEFFFNQIFIETTVYEHYMGKYKKGNEVLAQMTLVKSKQQLTDFYKTVGASAQSLDSVPFPHDTYRINAYDNSFYYYYPKEGSSFCLEDINRLSSRFTQKKNRPILIEMFNPENTHYVIISEKYKREDVIVNGWVYDKITIKKSNGQKFVTYIFNTDTQAYKSYVARTQNNRTQNKWSQKDNQYNQYAYLLVFLFSSGITAVLTYIIAKNRLQKKWLQRNQKNTQHQLSAEQAN